ncbi:hypothetical protein SteCoe_23032 [Stentor coeruleus]|uniref:Uncharacterized protein n=1 Tax=Stentor coeruleus TaxID=5963 RepID=A0A1R2BKU0_9CILI|nr:hypothetical protein SteCoe_23032 [Stentor coeruleus]
MRKRDLERSVGSVSTLSSRRYIPKINDPCEESLDGDSLFNCTLNSRKVHTVRRSDSDHVLASIIEEKVSNLKSKFGELTGLREKLIGSSVELKSPSKYLTINKPRLKSYERSKQTKNRTFLDSTIFPTEESRLQTIECHERDSDIEASKFFCNPNFEKFLFDSEPKTTTLNSIACECKTLKSEVESLTKKLSSTEKQLKDSERIRAYQESIIHVKDREIKEAEEKYKMVIEMNNTLKLHINRLENKLKNVDSRKSVNTNAIRNLSYIILSKESSPVKETSIKTFEPNTSNNVMLKYLEVLNELHTSDQFTLTVYEKLRYNQGKEALRMLVDIQETIHDRLQRTRKSVDELENIVYECKSPVLPYRVETESTAPLIKESEDNDLMCFMKCQASMVEELLMVN